MNPNVRENENLGGTGIVESHTGSASGRIGSVKDRATEMGRNAEQSVNRGMQTAADKLQRTASSLRSNAPADNKVGQMANRAADSIEHAASYMRDHDVRDVMTDVEGAVRRNPGPSLAVAAAFGFLLGMAIRSSGRQRY
jgi:ElaB/YqjD/DUF883 family membrane-anchored ribosome-binding protein